jgi:uncharacterized GH25 family protein
MPRDETKSGVAGGGSLVSRLFVSRLFVSRLVIFLFKLKLMRLSFFFFPLARFQNRAALVMIAFVMTNASVLTTLHTAPVLAHDTWLLPQKTAVGVKQQVKLDITSGMAFPRNDHAITADRVERSSVRVGSSNSALINATMQPKFLTLSGAIGGTGIGLCAIVLRPKTLELKPKDVAHYLEEIGASESLRSAWKKPTKTMRWRERYAKHTKSFIAVGTEESNALEAAQNDSSWSQPAGLKLEIVPQKNPCSLRVGDDFSVLVLRDGKPLADVSIGCTPAGVAASAKSKGLKKTDANGIATFKLSKKGWHLFRGTDLRAVNTAEVEFESDFTTLTLFVRP